MFYHPDDDPQKSSQQIAWGALILFMIAIAILIAMVVYLLMQNRKYIELMSQGRVLEASQHLH